MSEMLAFVELGFRHITDLAGLDHVLFLVALAAIYRPLEWRRLIWVVTSFTAGHSVTLALAATGALQLPTNFIEFLIPVTIVATCIENLVTSGRVGNRSFARYRPVLAGVFGLIHGAGFANYLRSLFMDQIALPLFGFNVGIELGQLVVLVVALAAFALVDGAIATVMRARRAPMSGVSPLRLRAIAVSSLVGVAATRWALERLPW